MALTDRSVVVLALLAGCGDAAPTDLEGHHARRLSGALGTAAEVTPLLGLFTVNARVNDTPTAMLVDTGAPLTFVAPTAGVPAGPQRLRALGLADATLYDVPAIGDDPFGLAPQVGGVLGVNVICQFNATWDWQRQRFVLGDAPTNVELVGAPMVIPFTLRGGGRFVVRGRTVAVPPTRIVLAAEIEGVPRSLLLDTGASTSALRSDLIESLARDRRSVRLGVTTQDGVVTQRLLRVRGLRVAGIDATAPAVVGYDAAALATISAEVGAPLDGLLGADLLRGHLLSIAYPAGRLTLHAYRDTRHVRDRWVRVGVLLARGGGGWRVQALLEGTAAETRGLQTGVTVTSIDGVALAPLGLDAVEDLLLGRVGETRVFQTASGSFTLPVEDVVPLP
ncbi:MAG: aspartyl protease family protein [Polyangiales bacterium]